MVNPDQAWNSTPLFLWIEITRELTDLQKIDPDRILGLAFEKSFKVGVKTADRFFSDELKPENRQN